jgi:protein-tyrosine phosphatase
MDTPTMVRICFVCLGNICRSPTAEGVMRHLLEEEGLQGHVRVESAGTGDWHVGCPPDERTQAAALRRGYRLTGQARQFVPADFERFDYVVAMDASNRRNLEQMAPSPEQRARVHLLRDFEPGGRGKDVPDPYYGGEEGFERVLDICESGCRGLLEHVRRERGL